MGSLRLKILERRDGRRKMRLIDADALYKTIDQEADFYGRFGDNMITASELRRCIEMVPIIDAVPVVRCRECKYRKVSAYEGEWCWNQDSICYGKRIIADWYCADGRRMGDEA